MLTIRPLTPSRMSPFLHWNIIQTLSKVNIISIQIKTKCHTSEIFLCIQFLIWAALSSTSLSRTIRLCFCPRLKSDGWLLICPANHREIPINSCTVYIIENNHHQHTSFSSSVSKCATVWSFTASRVSKRWTWNK